jgi:DNA-binding transcriptional regulator YiaG
MTRKTKPKAKIRAKRTEFIRGGEHRAAAPYHYTACGLDDVYLLNGFTVHETEYGRGISVKDVDDLHQEIGLHLVMHRKALSPGEFRFLRKQLNLTQDELATCLGVDGQTVARYEKGATGIPSPSDRLLRFVFVLSLMPEGERAKLLTDIMEMLKDAEDEVRPHPAYFESTKEGWLEAGR